MSIAPSRISQLLPARIEVSTHALARIVSALNGPAHHIRELQVTRGALFDNPIDVIERELLTAQAAPVAAVYLSAVEEAEAEARLHPSAQPVSEEDIQGELFNHQRVGGPTAMEVIDVVRRHFGLFAEDDPVRKRCESAIKKLFKGK